MANTSAQAIAFDNTVARPTADALATAYYTAKKCVSLWNAQSIISIIPNDATLIQDGATVASGTPDGRPPVTDGQINVLISNLNSFISFMEANSNLILNQTVSVAVNTLSKV